MSTHVVMLGKKRKQVVERIEEHYPKNCQRHFSVSPNTYLLKTEDTAEEVAEKLGIDGSRGRKGATGVVFALRHFYAGFGKTNLWEWLRL